MRNNEKESDTMRIELLMMMRKIRKHSETLTALLPADKLAKHEKIIEDTKRIESKYIDPRDVLR